MGIYVSDYELRIYPSSSMLNTICNLIGNKKVEYLDMVLNDIMKLRS